MTCSPQSRRSLAHTAALLSACALVAAMISSDPARARPPADGLAETLNGSSGRPLPEIIGARPKVRQMITISSPSFASTSGTLKAWRRDARAEWVLARRPVQVVLGYRGWVKAKARNQSTGTTPAGRFRLPYAFGNSPDPGAQLSYRHVDAGDWWPYEPRDAATYNVYQPHRAARTRWRADYAERLASYGGQYGYALVVGFNLPSGVHYSKQRRQWVARNQADTTRGGGIFLHVRGDGLTAGCVAMSRRNMRWVVRWVRPGAQPRLVMGPHAYIVTL
ncbi:MAG: L,D-transpeptidase family protein [Nocardioidaceae bacterium]|nr:L,D-transpeptidase family protein [Nocardioidaceae bacterium]